MSVARPKAQELSVFDFFSHSLQSGVNDNAEEKQSFFIPEIFRSLAAKREGGRAKEDERRRVMMYVTSMNANNEEAKMKKSERLSERSSEEGERGRR